MSEEHLNEQQIPDYQMPTTDLSSEGSIIGTSGAADVITATGNLNPNNFWMVVLIVLLLGYGAGTVFWITNLYGQIKEQDIRLSKKDVKIEQLQKELDEAPQKTLDELIQTHNKIQELRGDIKATELKVDARNKDLLETNYKLKQVEEKLSTTHN